MELHFIDVGIGNMTIVKMPDGIIISYDCNITSENKDRVLRYVAAAIGQCSNIGIFVNSHRDADHFRGIKDLHRAHPIQIIWDSGVPGTTTDSPEYKEYMDLRRTVGYKEIEARKFWSFGEAKLRCLNSAWPDFTDANQQSIVLKVEYRGSSAMLTGDTDYRPWKEKILSFYDKTDLSSSILLAAHHGSLAFFDDPGDSSSYYIQHISRIAPAMTVVSVGPNNFGLPDKKAIELYAKYSSGSDKGNKVFTTQDNGTMRLILKDEGGWTLYAGQ